MARPKNSRIVQLPPRVKGFIPVDHVSMEFDPIQLNIEEYEVIRLLDYENLAQERAAEIMGVSRPTVTRIYQNARKVIAKALTEGRQIIIDGGKLIYKGVWYYCENCFSRFNNAERSEVLECPLCSNSKIIKQIK